MAKAHELEGKKRQRSSGPSTRVSVQPPLPAKTEGAVRPVLVCTEFRGVFFGYAADTSGDTVHLKRARNVVYWPQKQRGFLGLAASGPLEGSRVGPAADIDLRKVTCVAEVTPEAVKRFEEAPWK